MIEWPEIFLTELHLCFKTSNLHPVKIFSINEIQSVEAIDISSKTYFLSKEAENDQN